MGITLRRALLMAGLLVLSCLVTAAAEDYSLQYEEIWGSSEAELIIRYGDIDNLGFGWPEGFDPFSEESTPEHPFPWMIDPGDAEGTDRIMVVSSYVDPPPHGTDGYTATTSRPENIPQEIIMTFAAPPGGIHAAVLQMFVDDFQCPVFLSRFQVRLNGMRVPELEEILNALDQSGPIGKLVTFRLPAEIVASMQSGQLRILVDDPETGAGDGFAFDFFRLLINPHGP